MSEAETGTSPARERGGFWRALRSVRLAIALLLILAAACAVGMVVPQNAPQGLYLKAYGELGSRLLRRLGATDVFHSPWFYLLALALAVNLTACSIHRFRLTWRRNYGPARPLQPAQIQRMAHHATWRAAGPVQAAEQALTAALRGRRYAVRRAHANPGGVCLHAIHGRLGNWGSAVLHLSVLLIFVGILYGHFPGLRVAGRTIAGRGFEYQASLVEAGQPYSPPGADFSVRLRRFRVPVDQRGQAEQFYSDLEIIENGKVVEKPTIWVNHPYSRDGFSFYQTSWELEGFVVRVTPPGGEPQDLFVPASERGFDIMASIQPLKTPKWVFFVHDFTPDGVIVDGHVHTRSPYPANPMALVFISEALELKREAMRPIGWIAPGRDRSYNGVKFSMVGAVSRSALTVRRDPGIPIVWAGFWLLMAGLVLKLYLPARALRVHIAPEGEQVRIVAGAEGVGAAALERDLAALAKAGPLGGHP